MNTSSLLLALIAMLAFAANSLLNRVGLASGDAQAWSFTLIRILSGAAILLLLTRGMGWKSGSWSGAISLLLYAGCFSYAYLALDAGVGALILFAAVQFTMLGGALKSGETFNAFKIGGFTLAFGGLVFMLLPGSQAPNFRAALIMSVAGLAWGNYSLLGKSAKSPILNTSGNFLRASLIAIIMSPALLMAMPETLPNQHGIAFATLSGAIASGLGYALWYKVLPSLTRTQAGTLQLSVPVFAALCGIILLNESLTIRFLISGLAIIIGVALVLYHPSKSKA